MWNPGSPSWTCTITIWQCVGSNAVQESVPFDRNVWYTFAQCNMEQNHLSLIKSIQLLVGEWTTGAKFTSFTVYFWVKIGAQPTWWWSDHKMGQSPHTSLIFPLFSPKAVSAPLNHPKSLSHLLVPSCPGITQHIPALSPTFNLALLPPWNAWYVHRHARPLHPHRHNQQCWHMPGLVIMVFHIKSSSQWQAWHQYRQTWSDRV